tara:strand:- start:713 stop:943 length:231 start_codon:yes stop_codon:yes gene_type:complete
MGFNPIKMEVVKSSGGNWTENPWVKEAVRTAYLQRDTKETVEHNYEPYKEHKDELGSFVNRQRSRVSTGLLNSCGH